MASAASVYTDPADRLTPQQRWAVTATWRAVADSSPQVMCDAWQAVLGIDNWPDAVTAAGVAGAAPTDACLLADAATASVSPNQRRQNWIEAVEGIAAQADSAAGLRCREWLIDADLTLDPVLGERIAAEAAALALANIAPARRLAVAGRLALTLNSSHQPDPGLVLRACRQAGAFLHRDRCYLLRVSPPRPPRSVAASDGTMVARGACMWLPSDDEQSVAA